MSTTLRVHSGREVDLLDPHPCMICWDDISRSLYAQERYLGHLHLEGQVVNRWSVAHHSLLVSKIYGQLHCEDITPLGAPVGLTPKFMTLVCLLHDAAEAYIGDINWVLKQSSDEIQQAVEQIQNNLLKTIFTRMLMEISGSWVFPEQEVPKNLSEDAMGVLKIYRDVVKPCDVEARKLEIQLLIGNYLDKEQPYTYQFIPLLSESTPVTPRTIEYMVRGLIKDLRLGGFEFGKPYPGSSLK